MTFQVPQSNVFILVS